MKTMEQIEASIKGCTLCRLGQPGTAHRKNIVFGSGNRVDPKVLIIGEAPGPQEDETGIPFIGTTGNKLRSTLKGVGLDPDKDCFITNAVMCFPYDPGRDSFRGPLGDEILACRPRLVAQVRSLLPSLRAVLLLGKRALVALLESEMLKNGALDREQDWNKPSMRVKDSLGWVKDPRITKIKSDLKAYCAYHPSFILRQKASLASGLGVEWQLDLQAVKRWAIDGVMETPRV